MIWMCVINRRFKDMCVHNRVDYIAINKAQRLGEEKTWGHKSQVFILDTWRLKCLSVYPCLFRTSQVCTGFQFQ